MTTVVPTPPAPPATAATIPPPRLVVADPPPEIAKLPLGARLEGTVVAQDAKGLAQIQTPLGTVLAQGVVLLPKGSALVLQIVALGPQLQLQVATIDGKPAPAALRQIALGLASGGPGAAASGTGAAAVPASAPGLAPGATVSAVLLRIPPAAGPGTDAAGGVHRAAAGAPGAAGAGAGQTSPAAAPATPSAGRLGSAPIPGAGPPATAAVEIAGGRAAPPLQPGSEFAVRILGVQPPSAGAPPPAPLPGAAGFALGATLAGTVAGHNAMGQPIVDTHAGMVAFAVSTALPKGTSVIFQVTERPPPTADAGAAHPLAAKEGLVLTRQWPNLDDAFRAIQEANPALAHQLVNSVVPQVNAKLAANVLAFLAALKGGDVRGWLGEAASRTLERAKPNLMPRLQEDFQALARMAEDPVAADWRIALVPFYNGTAIEAIRLFMRRRGGREKGKKGDPEGTRFVVDVELSRLGRLQLDGLVRGKKKRFDLILRTARPLPSEMQQDIRRIFVEAGELTGVAGGISFQATPANFVEIAAEDVIRARLGLTV